MWNSHVGTDENNESLQSGQPISGTTVLTTFTQPALTKMALGKSTDAGTCRQEWYNILNEPALYLKSITIRITINFCAFYIYVTQYEIRPSAYEISSTANKTISGKITHASQKRLLIEGSFQQWQDVYRCMSLPGSGQYA